MMAETSKDFYGYARGNSYQAVDVPYSLGEVSMTILLPDEGFGSIFRLLRDRPWVVPWDEWKPAGMPGRRGPDDYRELRRRVGLSLEDFMDLFPNNAAAEAWFIQHRWPDGVRCPDCRSDSVFPRPTRKPQPFRCRACRCDF